MRDHVNSRPASMAYVLHNRDLNSRGHSVMKLSVGVLNLNATCKLLIAEKTYIQELEEFTII